MPGTACLTSGKHAERGCHPPRSHRARSGQTRRRIISKEATAQRRHETAETGKHRWASGVPAERNYPELEGTPERLLPSWKALNGCWIKGKTEGKHLSAGKQGVRGGVFICYFYFQILYIYKKYIMYK